MPKSKNRKNHKQKVAARNQRIQAQKNKIKKFQDAFYQQMKAEMESGAFDDNNLLELPKEDSEESTEVISDKVSELDTVSEAIGEKESG